MKDHLVLAAPNTKKYQKIFAGESDSGESDLRQILEVTIFSKKTVLWNNERGVGQLGVFWHRRKKT